MHQFFYKLLIAISIVYNMRAQPFYDIGHLFWGRDLLAANFLGKLRLIYLGREKIIDTVMIFDERRASGAWVKMSQLPLSF